MLINLNSWLWPRISGAPCIISCATVSSLSAANLWKMLNSIHIWAILSVPLLQIGQLIGCNIYRRNCFVGQTNNLCFFQSLRYHGEAQTTQSDCSSIYGCELWALSDDCIKICCTAWRTGLRHVISHVTRTFFFQF